MGRRGLVREKSYLIFCPLTQSKDFLLLYMMGKGGRRTQVTKVAEEREAKVTDSMEVASLESLSRCRSTGLPGNFVLTEGWKFMQISLSCHNLAFDR